MFEVIKNELRVVKLLVIAGSHEGKHAAVTRVTLKEARIRHAPKKWSHLFA
jgi:hypothetical protein